MNEVNLYANISKVYPNRVTNFWDRYYSILTDNIKFNENLRILDLGCGIGTSLEYFKSRCIHYTGVDHSIEMLSLFKSNLKSNIISLVKKDISEFYVEEKFDLILCSYDTVNHILDKNKWQIMLSNCSLMMNKDSILVIDYVTKYDHLNNWKNYLNVTSETDYYEISRGYFSEGIASIDYDIFVKIGKTWNLYKDSMLHVSFSEDVIDEMINKSGLFTKKSVDFQTGILPKNESQTIIRIIQKKE